MWNANDAGANDFKYEQINTKSMWNESSKIISKAFNETAIKTQLKHLIHTKYGCQLL